MKIEKHLPIKVIWRYKKKYVFCVQWGGWFPR
jgi:hypothetical protein